MRPTILETFVKTTMFQELFRLEFVVRTDRKPAIYFSFVLETSGIWLYFILFRGNCRIIDDSALEQNIIIAYEIVININN